MGVLKRQLCSNIVLSPEIAGYNRRGVNYNLGMISSK